MDYITLMRRWCLIFCLARWKGCTAESTDEICIVDPSAFIASDGTFEVYRFEAKEGILLESRKLLGTVILSGNGSAAYSYDEPYFTSPRNQKVAPRPKHFIIVFDDINSNNDSTTVTPTSGAAVTSAPPTANSTTDMSRPKRFYEDTTGSAGDQISQLFKDRPADSTFMQTITYTSIVASNQNHTDFTTEEASTVDPFVQCVKAYIYQIYDLDREKQDTHYLTINTLSSDFLNIPILIVINVSDINDNTPVFDEDSLSSTIRNDTAMGLIVGQIKAEDADIGANADLRYEMLFYSERRGNETESSFLPSVLVEQTTGIVVLVRSIDDLTPPSKLTFSVVVKDNGGQHACNRATATATISIVNVISPTTMDPSSAVPTGIIGIAVGCSVAAAVVIGLIVLVVYRFRRNRAHIQNDGALEFMLDDDTVVSA